MHNEKLKDLDFFHVHVAKYILIPTLNPHCKLIRKCSENSMS